MKTVCNENPLLCIFTTAYLPTVERCTHAEVNVCMRLDWTGLDWVCKGLKNGQNPSQRRSNPASLEMQAKQRPLTHLTRVR